MKLSGWWKYMYQKDVKKLLLASIFCLVLLLLVSGPDETLFTSRSRQLLSFTFQQVQEIESACSPKQRILFLKTHKCASSTIQNIFLRYGYKNNLTFALPRSGNYLGYFPHFKASMLPPSLLPSSGIVDIFCLHTRLNADEMRKVVHKDAVWVTVLREPVSLFESLFRFFHLKGFYNLDLEEFPNVPFQKLMNFTRKNSKFGRNQMLFDLGFEENISVTKLQEAIHAIDELFDFVMIAERMDESLVLLRHHLCWEKEDMVYFTKNARQQHFRSNITRSTRSTLMKLNSADKILYDHFLAKHELNVATFGYKQMELEVAELRALQAQAFEDCSAREVNGKDSSLLFPEYSGMVSAVALTNNSDETCLSLAYPELKFIDIVRKKQAQVLQNNNHAQGAISQAEKN